MLKTYQSKRFINRSVNIEVDGKIRVVTFTGGTMYPKTVCGIYSTLNVKEQKALESHPGYGVKFILLRQEGTPKNKIKEVVLLEEKAPVVEEKKEIVDEIAHPVEENIEETIENTDENTETIEDVSSETTEEVVENNENAEEVQGVVEEQTPENNGVTEIFEVEKVQEAKDYLMKTFKGEFTHRALSNKNLILAAAKEKNISFPNIQ